MELKSAPPVSSQLLITLLDTVQEITPSPISFIGLGCKKKKKILCVQYIQKQKARGCRGKYRTVSDTAARL